MFEIVGLGTALPEHSISQAGAATFATTCVVPDANEDRNTSALIQALYRRAGVQSRHSVLLESSSDGEATAERFYRFAKSPEDRGPSTAERMRRYEADAPQLAATACQKALVSASVDPKSVTHLITVSCSGFSAPGVDLFLIRALGLQNSVSRTHVGFMGCHGALNGLRVAHAFAQADPNAVVLLCAVELCTLHHQYGWDPQKIVANSLFADGAAAVVGRATNGPSSGGSAHSRLSTLVSNASYVIPDTAEMMTWNIRDAGFEMTLSAEVPNIITRFLPGVLAEFLGRHGLKTSDIPSWGIHPGGPRILTATAEAAGLTDEQLAPSLGILRRCGNMSSPTILFILNELRQANASGPTVLLGFGPGLNVELALLNK
ncbi:MAG: type III polyketide synthase [Planctomycetaceae bacterium]|nr:type III polyketide synthase [Planctomycetaceae bacterium]